nr:immunoglobulin heavy chain junction region [Mus musculus]
CTSQPLRVAHWYFDVW